MRRLLISVVTRRRVSARPNRTERRLCAGRGLSAPPDAPPTPVGGDMCRPMPHTSEHVSGPLRPSPPELRRSAVHGLRHPWADLRHGGRAGRRDVPRVPRPACGSARRSSPDRPSPAERPARDRHPLAERPAGLRPALRPARPRPAQHPRRLGGAVRQPERAPDRPDRPCPGNRHPHRDPLPRAAPRPRP